MSTWDDLRNSLEWPSPYSGLLFGGFADLPMSQPLKIGMAFEEVVRDFGHPNHRVHIISISTEILFYSHNWPWAKSAIVFLQNGKVDGWRYEI